MPRAGRIDDDVSLQEIGVAILRAVPQVHAECEMVAYCLMLLTLRYCESPSLAFRFAGAEWLAA
jgi:hypothetical protein